MPSANSIIKHKLRYRFSVKHIDFTTFAKTENTISKPYLFLTLPQNKGKTWRASAVNRPNGLSRAIREELGLNAYKPEETKNNSTSTLCQKIKESFNHPDKKVAADLNDTEWKVHICYRMGSLKMLFSVVWSTEK